jgi:glycosyltransferase involved in cell wall biosynthesis
MVAIDAKNGQVYIPLIIGPFPPPIYGSAVIDLALETQIEARGFRTVRVDTAAGTLRHDFSYHLARARVFLAALAKTLRTPGGGLRPSFLLSVNGGIGIIYDIAFAVAARLRRAPLFLYHHSAHYVDRPRVLARLLLRVAGRGAVHVACSPVMLKRLQFHYGRLGSFLPVSNAAWVITPAPAPPRHDARLNLGMLSILNTEKGLSLGLETLRLGKASGLPVRLWLAGAPVAPEDDALIGAAQQEFGDDLVRCGSISEPQKAAFFAGLDAFLFPSRYRHETQSLVVPEALAAGVPVIAFDHRYVGEIAGQSGLLVASDADYPSAAVDWMRAKWADQSLRGGARHIARRQFDHVNAAAANDLDRLITALVEGTA